MQINLFGWIRQSVRQSVLLGVSDALDDIGQPDTKQSIAKTLRKSAQDLLSEDSLENRPKTAPKRLGRSLKDIETAAK